VAAVAAVYDRVSCSLAMVSHDERYDGICNGVHTASLLDM
jgi:hypothetical protein